jgi:TorA maturation chaperone TorD
MLRVFGEVFGHMDGAVSKSGLDPVVVEGIDSGGDVTTCALQTSGVRPAAEAALAWIDNVANTETVQAEHIRLFGGDDPLRQMPSVSPFASTYDSLSHDSAVASVMDVYREHGFVPICSTGRACPTHISNELEFVSFLLKGAADGNEAFGEAAHLFVADHLSTWAVLFSAAVHSCSEHPVTQFAGLALEHLLLCERERALFDVFVGNTPS